MFWDKSESYYSLGKFDAKFTTIVLCAMHIVTYFSQNKKEFWKYPV